MFLAFPPQAGQGMDMLPTQQTLSQGKFPVSNACMNHHVRTGMLEHVWQAMVAVSHLKSINTTWAQKPLEDK